MWCVYILYSAKLDKYYVGRSEDVDRRLHFHNHPIETRKFTARGLPWLLLLTIPCETKGQSIRLEKLIKAKKSRKFVELLIADEAQVQKLIQETCT